MVQLWPAVHTVVHEPQCAVVVTSVQVEPHNIWLAPQPQAPLLQVLPEGQTVQLLPQWAASLLELHAPSLHFVVPDGHDPEQALLTQTCALVQAVQLDPQCCRLDGTHWLLHETRPCWHAHVPF